MSEELISAAASEENNFEDDIFCWWLDDESENQSADTAVSAVTDSLASLEDNGGKQIDHPDQHKLQHEQRQIAAVQNQPEEEHLNRREAWFGEEDHVETERMTPAASETLRKICEQVMVDYPLIEVMKQEGIGLRRSKDNVFVANCPSPIHVLRSPTLRIDPANPNHFNCSACGASGGVLAFVGLIHGAASLGEQYRLLTCSSLATIVPAEHFRDVDKAIKRRSEDLHGLLQDSKIVSQVYEALLNRLDFYFWHQDFLRCQYAFLDKHDVHTICREQMYRSLPLRVKERLSICEALQEDGYELSLVQAFFIIPGDTTDESTRGRWCFAGDRWGRLTISDNRSETEEYPERLIVPIRNRFGHYTGIELHSDKPSGQASARVREQWPRNCARLVAAHQEGDDRLGATGGAQLHYAAPPAQGVDQYPGGVVLTYSALQADALACRFNVHVLGVPVFGLLVDETLEAISRFERLCIIADKWDESQVSRLRVAAEERGISTEIVSGERQESGCYFEFENHNNLPFSERAARDEGARDRTSVAANVGSNVDDDPLVWLFGESSG